MALSASTVLAGNSNILGGKTILEQNYILISDESMKLSRQLGQSLDKEITSQGNNIEHQAVEYNPQKSKRGYSWAWGGQALRLQGNCYTRFCCFDFNQYLTKCIAQIQFIKVNCSINHPGTILHN